MRVLTITNMYPPHHYGGYELGCAAVMEEFRRHGHEVRVVTSDHRIAGIADDASGTVPVDRTLRMYWRDHEVLRPGLAGRVAIERHNRRVMRRVIDDFEPDVVSAWALGALSMSLVSTARDLGVPVVAMLMDDWLCYGPKMDAWNRMLRRRPVVDSTVAAALRSTPARKAVDGVSVFCFISRATAEAAIDRSPFRIEPIAVTYGGIDDTVYDPDHHRDTDRSDAEGWRLLYVGRLDPRKGVDTTIRALAHLPPDTELVITGRGDDEHRRELNDLVRDLGLGDRVRFQEKTPQELPGVYASADVFLFPSIWPEPFGFVPIEAMACGTPVIATGVGGSGEFLVDGHNCVIVPPGEDRDLADAVSDLLSDPSLRTRLIANGRTLAAELTIGNLAHELERWHLGAAQGSLPPLEDRTIQALPR